MKLCRFELASAPGSPRTGIYHSGRIYETQGVNPIAQHDFSDIVLLTPTGTAPSYRYVQLDRSPPAGGWEGDLGGALFTYINPATVIAPHREFPKPLFSDRLTFEPQLAVVIATPGRFVSTEDADGLILGFSVANTFVARDAEEDERRYGSGSGRSHHTATAFGPVITTPEELDEAVTDDHLGRRYRFAATLRVNGAEIAQRDLGELPYTAAQIISRVTESSPVVAGDIIGIGPIFQPDEPIYLEPGDEVIVNIERLGALSTRII